MRGQPFHNYLVDEAAAELREAGFTVQTEVPLNLRNGQLDFLDILVRREDVRLGCEIETSARHAVSNALKAYRLGLPLIVVVPNRKVLAAVTRKLEAEFGELASAKIWISLPGQLRQAVTNCFSRFSVGESRDRKRENKSSGLGLTNGGNS